MTQTLQIIWNLLDIRHIWELNDSNEGQGCKMIQGNKWFSLNVFRSKDTTFEIGWTESTEHASYVHHSAHPLVSPVDKVVLSR